MGIGTLRVKLKLIWLDLKHCNSYYVIYSYIVMVILTYFMPLISFDTPWKHQKTIGFQWRRSGVFIANIERISYIVLMFL